MKTTLLQIITITIMLVGSNSTNAQCVSNEANVYSFIYNGANYEVVRENKTWVDAAACAMERGGFLVEINDQTEQNAVYNQVLNNAGITASNTVAPDGGNASYVWIGGNDLGAEGEWIWDGENSGSGPQFWQGTSTGSPVGGLFNNWGDEPDDWNGQDGLGLAITDWPLGVSGQWNDVNDGNTLYFVIEYPSFVGLGPCISNPQGLVVFPNPVRNQLNVMDDTYGTSLCELTIIDMSGKIIKTVNAEDQPMAVIDVAELNQGVYYVNILYTDGTTAQEKFVK